MKLALTNEKRFFPVYPDRVRAACDLRVQPRWPAADDGRYIDGGHSAVAILAKGGTTIEAVESARSNRPTAETAAIIDAPIS